MKDVKHLPPPWEFRGYATHYVITGQNASPLLVQTARDPVVLEETWRRILADGRLMAASPDLLAELQAMYAVFYNEKCPGCGIAWTEVDMANMSEKRTARCACGYRQEFKGAAVKKATKAARAKTNTR